VQKHLIIKFAPGAGILVDASGACPALDKWANEVNALLAFVTGVGF
jgi:hypothetical protein